MAGPARTILPAHQRRRRASFVLTSLIDVIFLLVIFFMVSSQVTPFSMILLGPIAAPAVRPQDAVALPDEAPPPTVVRVLDGRVTIDGRSYPRADVAAALDALRAQGAARLLLLPAASSTVQDLVTVLEAAGTSGFANVSILDRPGPAP